MYDQYRNHRPLSEVRRSRRAWNHFLKNKTEEMLPNKEQFLCALRAQYSNKAGAKVTKLISRKRNNKYSYLEIKYSPDEQRYYFLPQLNNWTYAERFKYNFDAVTGVTCHSLRAAVRQVKRALVPKGTVFRLTRGIREVALIIKK